MKDNTKAGLWLLWVILGMLPGVVLWLFLVHTGHAGEFAGILIGFGSMAFYRWSGAKMKYSRMIVGIVIIIITALLVNHIGYSLDIYNSFSEGWYGVAGVDFTFWDSVKTVFSSFLIKNQEGMRKFYIEAAVQGCLWSLMCWVVLFVYYRKMDELDSKSSHADVGDYLGGNNGS